MLGTSGDPGRAQKPCLLLSFGTYMGVLKNSGPRFTSPYNKDHSILGSIMGSPVCGNSHMSCMIRYLNTPNLVTLTVSSWEQGRSVVRGPP